MLYRPVYIKNAQAPITMVNPPQPPEQPPSDNEDERTPTPELPPLPPSQSQQEEETPEVVEIVEQLPMLISNGRFKHVIPREKTKDVLTGKVAYLLIEDTGVTRFEPKHILTALKLDRERLTKYEDYELIGGHRRLLEKRPTTGRRYKRRYISLDLIAKGIYGVSNIFNNKKKSNLTTLNLNFEPSLNLNNRPISTIYINHVNRHWSISVQKIIKS